MVEFTIFHSRRIAHVLGNNWMRVLRERGWNAQAYNDALRSKNEDQITLTNPFNWMTEDEVNTTGA